MDFHQVTNEFEPLPKADEQKQQETVDYKKQAETLSQTNRALHRRIEELEILNRITETLALVTDPQPALKTVVQQLVQFFQAHSCEIILLNTHNELNTIAHHSTEEISELSEIPPPLKDNPITTQVIDQGQPVTFSEIQTHPLMEEAHEIIQTQRIQSLMFIPLMNRGQVIGIMGLDRIEPQREFTLEEVSLAETIAGQIARAIEHAHLFEQEHRQRQVAESLGEVATVLNSSLDQKTVLNKILEQLKRVIQYDSAAVFLRMEDELVISSGANLKKMAEGFRLSLGERNPVTQVFKQKESLILADVQTDPQWQKWYVPDQEEQIRSWIGIPLLIGQKPIGVLTVDNFTLYAYHEEDDIKILRTFATQAAIAIENARQVEQTEEALYQAGLLYRVGSILAKTSDFQIGIEKALEEYLWALDMQQGSIALFDAERQTLILKALYQEGQAQSIEKNIQLDYLPAHKKIQEIGRPLAFSDARNHALLRNEKGPGMADNVTSTLLVPMLVRGQVIGLLEASTTQKTRSFSQRELDLGQAIADQIATAVETSRLFYEEQRQREMVEQRNKELDAFARTVAHDLKNPLGVVVSYADYLFRFGDSLEPENMKEAIKTISQSARKGANIVNELLLLAGVRKQEVPIRPMDMDYIVRQAQQRLTFMIEEYEGEIHLPDKWPTAQGYGPWIEEVWVNYMSNGLKYGGQPPRLELGATPQPDGTIRFWVQDNGKGLTAEEQEAVFNEFSRLDEVRAKGHGLGLSIVHRIIQKLGGEIGVESEGKPGQGSLFYFTLPDASEFMENDSE